MTALTRAVSKENVLFGCVIAATLWLGLDGHHHWHEIRFSYVASQLSWQEILAGEFNPHQVDTSIDELSSAGFYFSKILHIWLLRVLFGWRGPSEGGFEAAVYLSVIAIGLAIFVCYAIFDKLLGNKRQASLAALCFLLLPITPYLAGKLLSEVTSLLFLSLSVLLLIRGIDTPPLRAIGFGGLGGLFLLFAALSRVDIVVGFFAFVVALLAVASDVRARRAVIKIAGVASVVLVVGYVVTAISLGVEIDAFARYFGEFVGSANKSTVMSILGVLTFGGVVYVVAAFSFVASDREKVFLLLVWFVLAFGISIWIASSYMVEPRYLVHGLLPLAGLGGIGIDGLSKALAGVRFKNLLVLGSTVLVLGSNAIIVRLMPYEMDRPALNGMVDHIMDLDQRTVILVPWAYTDFHFLRMTRPGASIYNVNSPIVDGKAVPPSQAWYRRFRKWYGHNYMTMPAELDRMVEVGPVYYVGWRNYPPAQYMREVVELFGLKSLSEVIDRFPLKNHLTQSWLWHSTAYELEPSGTRGQYEYYRVYSTD